MVINMALIFHMSIPCDKTFPWVIFFYLVTLTLMFDLLIQDFNFGYIFWLVSTWTLTFHISDPYDKNFM